MRLRWGEGRRCWREMTGYLPGAPAPAQQEPGVLAACTSRVACVYQVCDLWLCNLGVYQVWYLSVYQVWYLGVYQVRYLGVYQVWYLGVYQVWYLGVYQGSSGVLPGLVAPGPCCCSPGPSVGPPGLGLAAAPSAAGGCNPPKPSGWCPCSSAAP